MPAIYEVTGEDLVPDVTGTYTFVGTATGGVGSEIPGDGPIYANEDKTYYLWQYAQGSNIWVITAADSYLNLTLAPGYFGKTDSPINDTANPAGTYEGFGDFSGTLTLGETGMATPTLKGNQSRLFNQAMKILTTLTTAANDNVYCTSPCGGIVTKSLTNTIWQSAGVPSGGEVVGMVTGHLVVDVTNSNLYRCDAAYTGTFTKINSR